MSLTSEQRRLEMGQMQTPSLDHQSFDHMCDAVEDFEYLPTHTAPLAEPDGQVGAEREETALNSQILAGLVSPV